jgi:hypothetical protein
VWQDPPPIRLAVSDSRDPLLANYWQYGQRESSTHVVGSVTVIWGGLASVRLLYFRAVPAAVVGYGAVRACSGSARRDHAPGAAQSCKSRAVPVGAGCWRAPEPPCGCVGRRTLEPRTPTPTRSHRSHVAPRRADARPCPASSTSGGAHGVLSHAMRPVCEIKFDTCAPSRRSSAWPLAVSRAVLVSGRSLIHLGCRSTSGPPDGLYMGLADC